MSEFVDFVRQRSDKGTDPYVVNALAHLNFVAIHPFSDGNGRVGRLLCSLLMMREGYKAQAFWSLEQFLGEHAPQYGSVLAETLGPRWRPDAVVATGWIVWYLDAVAAQLTLAEKRLRRSMAEFSVVVAGVADADLAVVEPRQLGRIVIPVWLAITGGTGYQKATRPVPRRLGRDSHARPSKVVRSQLPRTRGQGTRIDLPTRTPSTGLGRLRSARRDCDVGRRYRSPARANGASEGET